MTNIPSFSELDNYYLRTLSPQPGRRRYGMISRHALTVPSPAFVLYAIVAVLANFKTRIADLKWRSGLLYSWRSRRQIRRILEYLEGSFLVRYGRSRYSLRGRTEQLEGASMRPINMHVLQGVRNESTALCARFIMWLAWSRKEWGAICLSDVQGGLKVRRETAARLYAWFRERALEGGRPALRRAVFYSTRPAWWKWLRRRARGRDPRRRGARFPSVRRGHRSFQSFEKLSECLTRTGLARPPAAEVEGRPSDTTGRQLIIQRRRRPTSYGLRSDGSVPPDSAAADLRSASLEECGSVDSSSDLLTFDKLVAGMPEQHRIRFLKDRKVRGWLYVERMKARQ